MLSVNVGPIEEVEHHGRRVLTGIFKQPVAGRVAVRGVNLDGDDQADRDNHGGPDRAVYAYSAEDLAWWETELGRVVSPGAMGENLTTSQIVVTGALVGERWGVGSAMFEVAAPRVPCFKLGIRMSDPRFPLRFARAGRPGAYLRIVQAGDVGAGDTIEVFHRPDHDVTVGLVARAFHDDHSLAPLLLGAPELSSGWREWADHHA